MKQLFLIDDNKVNKISYFHVMLLMVSLPFDRFYSHIILISLIAHTLIHARKAKWKSVFSVKTLVLQSLFFVTAVATAYTLYMHEAFNEWTLRLPVLVLPVVFAVNDLDLKKYRSNLLLAFALVCTGTVVYLYADALITINYYHLPLKTIFTDAFTNHNFSEPIEMHATFFSLQLIIGFVYLLTLAFKPGTSLLKAFYCACCIILLAGLIQLSSKSILAVVFIIINLVVPYCLLKGKNRLRYMLTCFIISVLAFTVLLKISSFRVRYMTSLKDDLAVAKPGESTEPRLARWHLVAGLIKQKPLIGYGSGAEYPLLHDEFFKVKMYSSFLANLNAHNQYFSFLIKSGTWGLLIYLLTLGYGFKIAFKNKDAVFICFILVIAIVSLSENVLDADKGVMFYSIFYALLLLCSDSEKLPVVVAENKTPEYLDEVATNSLVVTS
jgi:O-antigen ligase